jgi:hypothetical protein
LSAIYGPDGRTSLLAMHLSTGIRPTSARIGYLKTGFEGTGTSFSQTPVNNSNNDVNFTRLP